MPSNGRALATGMIVAASAIAMDPQGWYPFGPAKWHAVVLAVVFAVVSMLRSSAPRSRADDPAGESEMVAEPYVWSVARWVRIVWGALLVVLFAASIFGREPYYAWVGTPERRLGWLTWVLFAGCCWLGVRNAAAANRRTIARAVVVTTLFVGGYSAIELTLGAPIRVDTIGQRIGGPYGSAAFLAAALCLLVPVAAARAFDIDESRWWRAVAGAAAVLGVIALLGSGTRAGVVGLLAAAVVFAAATIRSRGAAKRAAVVVVAAGAVLGIGILASGGRLNPNVERVGRVFESSRLAEWEVGVRIVAAHPVLGVGPEGYRTALADGITAEYERTYGRDVIPDRAHNGIIDVAAAGGLAAGGLYLALVGGVVSASWHRLRTGTTTERGLAVALIAYAAQQMFLFPVSVIDPVFWLFAGLILARPGTRASDIAEASIELSRPDRSRVPGWAVDVVGATVAAIVVVSAVLALSADRLAASAVGGDRVDLAGRATRLRPDFVRYWLLEDRLTPMTVSGISEAIGAIDDAAVVSPSDPVVRRRRAERLLDLAIATGEPADINAARDAWAALATDVNCYRCHLGFGYALALSGDRTAAIAAFDRAAELARPGDGEAASAAESLRRVGTDTDTEGAQPTPDDADRRSRGAR